jgi:hypothetical protein
MRRHQSQPSVATAVLKDCQTWKRWTASSEEKRWRCIHLLAHMALMAGGFRPGAAVVVLVLSTIEREWRQVAAKLAASWLSRWPRTAGKSSLGSEKRDGMVVVVNRGRVW